jgi:phosphonate transport system substrate-binding protein
MPPRTLRFATYLAPNLLPVYAFLVRRVGERLGRPTELIVGSCYESLAETAPVSFVCGLPYVLLRRRGQPLEPIAAPLLQGDRPGGRPVYYSDVVVRRDSRFHAFADLRGCLWGYNEPWSQSGYGITRHHLLAWGETSGYFGRVVPVGYHEHALRLIASGEIDAAAVDEQVLAVALRERPELRRRLRVIARLGPSTIQPVVADRRLPRALRDDIRAAFLEATDEEARARLAHGLIERYVPVDDTDYDDIRSMLDHAEARGFLTIR